MTIKWDYFGGGLTVAGIGLTLLLALPPPWWPRMPSSMIHFGIASGAVLLCVGMAIALVGIYPNQFENHQGPLWLLALSIGVALSAAMWWHWQIGTSDGADNNSLNGRILVECNDAGLPSTMPATGNVFHIALTPKGRPAQLGRFTLGPGAPIHWGFKSVAVCKCEVKNFSKTAIAQVKIPFKVSFYENTKTGSGNLITEDDYPIPIPAMTDNVGDVFEFYFFNASSLYATLSIPEYAFVWIVGEDDARTVKLMKPTFYRGVPLHPVEWEATPPTMVQP